MADPSGLSRTLAARLTALRDDLQQIFGARLSALVAHGPHVRAGVPADARTPVTTLALVEGLSYKDLDACARRARDWRAAGLAIPLLLAPDEFARSLDAFPIEYGDIIAHHAVVFGPDPFETVSVRTEDLRRACEAWGKSHLIHLREGYIEAAGDAREVAEVIVASASPFTALLSQIARLRGAAETGADVLARATEGIAGLPAHVVRQVAALEATPALDPDTAMTLYPAYLDAVERLARYLDGWARQ